MKFQLAVSLALLLNAHLCLAHLPETFDEELHLRPLDDGKLYSHFAFTILAPNSASALVVHDENGCECSKVLQPLINKRDYQPNTMDFFL